MIFTKIDYAYGVDALKRDRVGSELDDESIFFRPVESSNAPAVNIIAGEGFFRFDPFLCFFRREAWIHFNAHVDLIGQFFDGHERQGIPIGQSRLALFPPMSGRILRNRKSPDELLPKSLEAFLSLQRPLQDVLDGQRGDCRPRDGVGGWWRWSGCATRTCRGGQHQPCDQRCDTGWLLHGQLPDGSSFSVADQGQAIKVWPNACH